MNSEYSIGGLSGLASVVFLAALAGRAEAAEQAARQPTVAELTAQLSVGDAAARVSAAEALAEHGEAGRTAIPALIEALDDEDGEVRAASADALGRLALEPDKAAAALAAKLGDETLTRRGPVWALAGLALGSCGRPALPHVTPALKSRSTTECRAAMLAIYRAGKEAKETVPELIAILQQNDPQTRTYAINALLGIGPDAKDAVPELIQMLSSDDFHTQYWACRALGAIGPEARSATDELVRCLKVGVTSVRRNAAAAMGQIGTAIGQKGVDALVAALSDPIQPVRQNAVVALGDLKPLAERAVPVIEQMLQEPSKFTPRATAAKTLWRLDPQSPTPVEALLRDLTENAEPWVAAQVLGEIKVADSIIPRLTALLDSPNVWTRQYAAVALLEMGAETAKAKATLEELSRSDHDETRQTAAAALEKINAKPSSP
ncbi:MAG TPA: HEAT repeat domain-containing protein [Candidatus Anammoximicrobium sp.]|nr:HEAT repeat domain-containing protein [Candidatus Anammoximicrobium sp.]